MNNFKIIAFRSAFSLIAILALPLQTHAAFTFTQIHSFFQDPAYVSSNPPSYVSPTYYFDPGGYQAQCASYATSLGYTSTTDIYCAYSGVLHTGTAGAGDFGTGGNGGPIPIGVYNGVFTLYTTPLTTMAYSQLYTQLQTAWNAWFAGFSSNPSAPLPQSPNVCGTESFDINDLWGSAPYSAAKYSAANAADPTARCNVYHNVGGPSSPPIATLTANPSSVVGGSASALTFSCTNSATAASINNGVGSVAPASGGTVSVTPGSTTTYTLTCTNAQGSATNAATVTVLSGLTASCSVSPTTISSGSSATWTAVASGGAGSYIYSWTGTDGLTGTGSSISHLYSNPGANTASVTVTSGAQTVTQACSNSLTVNPAPTPNLTVTQTPSGATSFTTATPTTFSGSILNNGSGVATNYPNVLQVLDQAGTVSVARYAAVPATVTTGAAASSAVTGTIPANALPPATYQVRFCANMDTTGALVISESNPADNCGPTTTITVASSGSPATACTVSPSTLPSTGGTVTYSANPSGGATSPYTWTSSDGLGGPFGSGASATRTFTSANQGSSYGMTVSASPSGTSNCPSVPVGSVCSGTPTGTITATPNRVKSGVDKFTLTISNISNVGTSCVVTGPSVNQTFSANACTVTGISIPNLGPITTQSVYKLTCDGTKVGEAIVNILPNFREF